MTPYEAAVAFVATMPPLTPAQVEAAARILASVELKDAA